MARAVHHFDLWVREPQTAVAEWSWLFSRLGWQGEGSSWAHPDGTYAFIERSPDQVDAPHDRTRPGINHLAFLITDRALLDDLRGSAAEQGWVELYAEQYPHAGGDQHVALYLENSEGFEVEIVWESDS